MQTVRATYAGKDKLLTLWDFDGYNDPHLSPAWGLIAKARQTLESYWAVEQTTMANDRLSTSAKRDDTRAQALQRASQLGELQRQLHALKQKHETDRVQLSAVAPYNAENGAAMAILDIEIAKQVAAMEPAKRAALLVLGGDQRTVDALLRVPSIISGLSGEQLSSLTEIAVARRHPQKAAELAEQSLAIERAGAAVRLAFEELTAGLDLSAKVAAAQGDPGLIRHHAAEVIEDVYQRQQRENQADDDAA